MHQLKEYQVLKYKMYLYKKGKTTETSLKYDECSYGKKKLCP